MCMKKIYLLILLASLAVFSSCTRNFVPAMYLQDESYITKPFFADADSTVVHRQSVSVSGKLNASIGDLMGATSETTSNMLQVHQAHSFRSFTLAYGVHGTVGRVTVPAPSNPQQYAPQDSGSKSFQALGARLELGLKAPTNTRYFEWRLLNFSFNYSHEMGNYLRFRQSLLPASDLSYSRGAGMYSWGIFTEFVWRFGRRKNANTTNGLALKIGGLSSNFMDIVYRPNIVEADKKRSKNEENMVFALSWRLRDWNITYQSISPLDFPVPVLFGVAHGLQVSFNISDALQRGKKNKAN